MRTQLERAQELRAAVRASLGGGGQYHDSARCPTLVLGVYPYQLEAAFTAAPGGGCNLSLRHTRASCGYSYLLDEKDVVARCAEIIRAYCLNRERAARSEKALTAWSRLRMVLAQAGTDSSEEASQTLNLRTRLKRMVSLARRLGLDPKGGVILTKQTRAVRKLGKAWAHQTDWLLADWNGTEIVVLEDSKITEIDDALRAAERVAQEAL